MAENLKKSFKSPLKLTFFDRLQNFGRSLDSGTKELETLLQSCKSKEESQLANEAEKVLNDVVQEVSGMKMECSELLSILREECSQLNDDMKTYSAVVSKQEEIAIFYTRQMNKRGCRMESNKENVPVEEDHAQHVISGLTSIAYYEKGSVPSEFHHDGILVTPGLLSKQKNDPQPDRMKMISQVEKPHDETFVIADGNNEELPLQPKVLSTKDIKNILLPEEPVLMSRRLDSMKQCDYNENQPKLGNKLVHPVMELPPEPVLLSKQMKKSDHCVKKLNLDDSDVDDDEPCLVKSIGISPPNKAMPTEPIHSSKTPDKHFTDLRIPDSPELVSMKFYPSAKLLATIRQNFEEDSSQQVASAEGTNLGNLEMDHMVSHTPYTSAKLEKYTIPEPLPDPKSSITSSSSVIPSSPSLLSKQTMLDSGDTSQIEQVEDESGTLQTNCIKLMSAEEYNNLTDAVRNMISFERLNSCLILINSYLRQKSDTVLSLSEIQNELGFGKHAKDVSVFLLKSGRMKILKRCQNNPSYVLV